MNKLDFKIKENETKEHFIWRVYTYGYMTNQLTKEECGDVCQRELSEVYDESAYRKVIQGFYKVWNAVKDEYLIETDEALLERLAKIEEKEDELYKLKVKVSDKLREYRGGLRDDGRIESLLEYMVEASSNIPSHTFNNIEKLKLGENVGILKISDWHLGKKFKNYIGEFNSLIAKERIDRLINKTVKHCKTMNIGTLYVANGGDIIDGALRVTARVTQEEDAIEQVMHAYQMIKYLMETLVEFGIEVKYLSVLDNHSRLTPNWKEHIEKENFGKLIDFFLIENMKDKVDFISNKIDENIGYLELDGKIHVFAHGHLKAHTINNVVKNMSTVIGKRVDYVHLSHWHNTKGLTDAFSKIYVNGCLDGVDEYGFNSGYFSDPAQSLFVNIDGDNCNIEMILK